jgi:hypothetical protein
LSATYTISNEDEEFFIIDWLFVAVIRRIRPRGRGFFSPIWL